MKNSTNAIAIIAIIVGVALYNVSSIFLNDQWFMLFCGIGGFFYFFYLFYDVKTPEAIDKAFSKIGKHVSFIVFMLAYFMLVNWIVELLNVQPQYEAFVWLLVFTSISLFLCIPTLSIAARKRKGDKE